MGDRNLVCDNAWYMAASLKYLLTGMNEWDMVERRLGHSRQGEEDEQRQDVR